MFARIFLGHAYINRIIRLKRIKSLMNNLAAWLMWPVLCAPAGSHMLCGSAHGTLHFCNEIFPMVPFHPVCDTQPQVRLIKFAKLRCGLLSPAM